MQNQETPRPGAKAESRKPKRKPFTIFGTEVAAGTNATVELPIAELYTHTTLTMPLRVFHGRQAGPVMFVCGAIHGDEINGVDMVCRLIGHSALKRLRGTLLAIPVVNVFGFTEHSRYLPDRRDLNRSFPGSEGGSLAARLAGIFMREIVEPSDFGIDLHTGSHHRSNLPQVRACMEDPEVDRLARAFDVPVILDAPLREGSLREASMRVDTRVLVYETGGPLEFDSLGVRTGVRGIIKVMRATGMLSPSKEKPRKKIPSRVARSSLWARAPQSGILHTNIKLGQHVRKGALLGKVSDTFGEHAVSLEAPATGVVIGKVTMPLVNEGAALFHIARFDDPKDVSANMDTLRERALEAPELSPDPAEAEDSEVLF